MPLQCNDSQPYLRRFPHGWPTEEFMKSHLKNRCRYMVKMGYEADDVSMETNENDTDDGISDNDDISDNDEEIEGIEYF